MWGPISNFNWQLIAQNQLQLKERGVVSANYKQQFMFQCCHLTNYCAHVASNEFHLYRITTYTPTHHQESPLYKKLLGSVDSYNEWISCILSWHMICMPQVHQSVGKTEEVITIQHESVWPYLCYCPLPIIMTPWSMKSEENCTRYKLSPFMLIYL